MRAAGFSEMALAAATEVFRAGRHTLRHLQFQKALFLSDDQPKTIQLALSLVIPGEASVKFFTRSRRGARSVGLDAARHRHDPDCHRRSLMAPDGDRSRRFQALSGDRLGAGVLPRDPSAWSRIRPEFQSWRSSGGATVRRSVSCASRRRSRTKPALTRFIRRSWTRRSRRWPPRCRERMPVSRKAGSSFRLALTRCADARPGAGLWSYGACAMEQMGSRAPSRRRPRDRCRGACGPGGARVHVQRVGHDAAAILQNSWASGSTRPSGSASHASRGLTLSPPRPCSRREAMAAAVG